MHNTYVHQHHSMCQKISSMECINHMPLSRCQHVHLLICQPCASTNMPTMCLYQYANHVHLSICQTNTIYEGTIMHHHLHQASMSTMHQQVRTSNDVQHDYQLNSPTTCPNMYSKHMKNACIMISNDTICFL